mmetsp:Transcript_88690/g.275486  ORF Transcript_88690/g.275486 Transcript_88690/m.275486 type:complete len:124 (+) Transcript_88690:421-792(+)
MPSSLPFRCSPMRARCGFTVIVRSPADAVASDDASSCHEENSDGGSDGARCLSRACNGLEALLERAAGDSSSVPAASPAPLQQAPASRWDEEEAEPAGMAEEDAEPPGMADSPGPAAQGAVAA